MRDGHLEGLRRGVPDRVCRCTGHRRRRVHREASIGQRASIADDGHVLWNISGILADTGDVQDLRRLLRKEVA